MKKAKFNSNDLIERSSKIMAKFFKEFSHWSEERVEKNIQNIKNNSQAWEAMKKAYTDWKIRIKNN